MLLQENNNSSSSSSSSSSAPSAFSPLSDLVTKDKQEVETIRSNNQSLQLQVSSLPFPTLSLPYLTLSYPVLTLPYPFLPCTYPALPFPTLYLPYLTLSLPCLTLSYLRHRSILALILPPTLPPNPSSNLTPTRPYLILTLSLISSTLTPSQFNHLLHNHLFPPTGNRPHPR